MKENERECKNKSIRDNIQTKAKCLLIDLHKIRFNKLFVFKPYVHHY